MSKRGFVLLVSLFLVQSTFAHPSACGLAFVDSLLKLNYIAVDHAVENRGYVKAPISYDEPGGPQLYLFFRVIPSDGQRANLNKKPYLVIFHGGPGYPSKFARRLSYDYEQRPVDNLIHLSRYFNIVLMDPRGTDGNSSRVDLDDPNITPEIISKHFSFDNVARDYGRVIAAAVPRDSKLFILTLNGGAYVGTSYAVESMRHPESIRRPLGIAFTNPVLPNQPRSARMNTLIYRNNILHAINGARANSALCRRTSCFCARVFKTYGHAQRMSTAYILS